ncbi:unnamed protein product [Dracunculus medinensis]|uniref:Uncharacterized protein n=1 Tax=Dracunculus medinensis TaxID=318479 RepID=A0A0N4U3L3_DRAME|nr:unnamed protein product [Dracunculus medinensis]
MINIPITIHKNSLLLINKTRNIWKTPLLNKNVVGKYRSTNDNSQLLTYEMAMRPQFVGVRKAWLTWHTQNLENFKLRQGQTIGGARNGMWSYMSL